MEPPAGKSLYGKLLGMTTPQILWRVALPATLTFLMSMVFGLVDAYWIGKLGSAAMAALSAASILTWVLYSIGALGEVGVQALVSQSVGAGKEEFARRAVAAGLWLHAVLALVVLLPVYLLRFKIFAVLGVEPHVVDMCAEYIVPFVAGMGAYFLSMVAVSAFYAVGDSRTPALVLGVALVLNAILDPILIFGWFGAPRLELFGAGLATGIAKVLHTVVVLYLLARRGLVRGSYLVAPLRLVKLALKEAWLGLPIALNGVVFSGVYLVLVKILAVFGTVPIAALGIVHRIEGVAWFICVGFSVAAAAVAGQYTGAGKTDDAVKRVWQITFYLSWLMALISAVYIVYGKNLTAVFIEDAEVIAEGGRYLLIIGLFEVFLGWEVVYEESLGAVGASMWSLLIATPLSIARIPLAWLFAIELGFGVVAVWWVISVTTMLKGIGLAVAYSFGRWRKRGAVV